MTVYRDGESERRRNFLSQDGHRLFDPVRLCRVAAGHGRHWVILGSPLLPSQAGCAGDRGTVDGMEVLDVLEEDCGPLHIFERPPLLRIGEHVLVARDEAHRNRLARAHGALVLAVRELEATGAEVLATELVAGKAWIDFSGDPATIDLGSAIARDEPLRNLETYRAPIVERSGEIGRVSIEPTEAAPACQGSLLVRLLD